MAGQHEQRTRSRVRVALPVRVRQIGPPRDLVDLTETLDVSRNGIMFSTRQPYDLHSTVWVIMPYHPEAVIPEPEFPATVVRIMRREDGGSEIGLHFHSARSDQISRAAPRAPQAAPPTPQPAPAPVGERGGERRQRSRVRMKLPIRVRIRVRTDDAVEESETLDVSRTGVLFRSERRYTVGETVWVMMPYQPGSGALEVPARVVRTTEKEKVRCVALHFTTR